MPAKIKAVGFTGTRHGMTREQKITVSNLMDKIVHQLGATEAHHGCCVGSDAQFHGICLFHSLRIHGHPPTVGTMVHRSLKVEESFFKNHPQYTYLKRNHHIVDASDLIIATPDGPEKTRSGTWATIRYAKKSGVSVMVVMPDGTLELHKGPRRG